MFSKQGDIMNKIMYFRTSSFTIYDGTRVYCADWTYDGKKWFPWSKYFESEIEAEIYIKQLINNQNRNSLTKEVYQWWEPPCPK